MPVFCCLLSKIIVNTYKEWSPNPGESVWRSSIAEYKDSAGEDRARVNCHEHWVTHTQLVMIPVVMAWYGNQGSGVTHTYSRPYFISSSWLITPRTSSSILMIPVGVMRNLSDTQVQVQQPHRPHEEHPGSSGVAVIAIIWLGGRFFWTILSFNKDSLNVV